MKKLCTNKKEAVQTTDYNSIPTPLTDSLIGILKGDCETIGITGKRLKSLRTKKGYTQIQVQMNTGIDQSDYSKIENGHRYPSIEQARRLAILLDTSMDYIFGLTDEEKPYPRSI